MRNIALILSGGSGTRLGSPIPKQYIFVGEKRIIDYCLEQFQNHSMIDAIAIVASTEWQERINHENYSKFIGFADAGSSRQHSIKNGLILLKEYGVDNCDRVIIHDAARPNVDYETISACISAMEGYDGVLPTLPVKDTMYISKDGENISSLLNRSEVFAGQSPECFLFQKYYAIHQETSEKYLATIRGSSEIAYQNGLRIRLIPGEEHNYKITTQTDFDKFRREKELF